MSSPRINLEEGAHEMWELYGADAEKTALDMAEGFELRGDPETAKAWRVIANACRFYLGPSPHPKRPYGKLRPGRAPARRSAPLPNLRQLKLNV